MTMPLDSVRGPEVLVRGLDAPTQLREGERFSVSAEVESNVATSGTLHLLVDGGLASSQDVTVQPGSESLRPAVEPLSPATTCCASSSRPTPDTLAQNN